ncbi:MAG: hypothetical protein JXJ04_05830 [Spirochaetales bacterium]|nr:hypothetical protein [Spirochaetales bacterium]
MLYTALFIISITLISFELVVMRVFSVANWSTFGSMVISIALLGFGLAGTLLTFLQKKVKKEPEKWLVRTCFALTPAIVISYICVQYIPFNPVFIAVEIIQYVWLGCYYLFYAIPFFIGALFIGICFTVVSTHVHKLYFWNMFGSGVGGIILLFIMYLLPADKLIYFIITLSSSGSICILAYDPVHLKITKDTFKKLITVKHKALAVTTGVLFLSFICLIFFGSLRPSQLKSVELDKVTYSDFTRKHYEYGPTGEIEVYASSQYHFAPGLSDNVIFYIDEMPKNVFWGLYINGDGPINIMGNLSPKDKQYIDFLPMSGVYSILDNPKVLLIHLGGGFSTQVALHNKAEKITIVEPNEVLVSLMKDKKVIKDFNNDLFNNQKITIVVNEPRAYTSITKESYDLVEIGLIDSIGLSQRVGNPITEDYIYTVEAIEDYMKCLSENGMIAFTVWNHLAPPRNVPKLLTTIITALKKQNIPNPENRIFGFHLMYSTATIIVKKSDFTPSEISKLNNFCYDMSFDVFWYPGMEKRDVDFKKVLASYHYKYNRALQKQGGENLEQSIKRDLGDFYHSICVWSFAGREQELYNSYIFNIKPPVDNSPYFTSYMKPESLGIFLDDLDAVSEEWGYFLIIGTLIQSLIFGFLIILIPLIGCRQNIFKQTRGTIGIIIYYSCLGLGYMLIEIFLIQRLVYFLANPIFSVSIVITFMLILSGLGSLFCKGFIKSDPTKTILIVTILIGCCILFYIFFLTPILNSFLGLPFIIKSVIAVLLITPIAFLMGMPFPTGLSELSTHQKSLLPWAWGMNGALSVTGSVLAHVITIHFSFTILLCAALVLYVVAGILFKVNRLKEKS